LLVLLILVLALVVPASAGERLRVVTTTPVLSDVVRAVGGDRVEVVCLVPPNTDLHTYEPKPTDVAQLAGADLVVVNGLGLEGWLDRVVVNSGFTGPVVVASKGVEPAEGACAEGHDHGAHEGHDHALDPHAWMDVRNVMVYAINVREGLVGLDAGAAWQYEALTDLYLAELRALDAWIKREVSAIPREQRWLVTDHAAFGYFARAYGFETRSVAGVSTRDELTAAELGGVARLAGERTVTALFPEFGSRSRALAHLAHETGIPLAGALFVDVAGQPGDPSSSYTGMMRANVVTIRRALAAP
jgi:zinc/manganese transport system substrate-binding protein